MVNNKKAITTIKGKKGQQLNQREVQLISEQSVEGLLLFDVQNKNNGCILSYNVDGLIPLSDFLRLDNMNRCLFVVLLRNIILVLKGVEDYHFSRDLLMRSLQSTYIDPSTWHVYMMYVPLQPFETTGNLKSFLLDIISQCNFGADEDIEYVRILVQELNSVTACTVGMLESYCDRVSEELLQQKRKDDRREVCPACGSKLVAAEEVCPFCGKRILSRTVNMSKKEEPETDPEFWPVLYQNESETEKVVASRKSISVNEDENGVVTVFRGSQRIVQSVWLEDCTQDGKIFITKFPFRIGKMEGVTDFRIFNNTVSRKHADILKEQGKYYICDLGSTNGTYLCGKRIQPGVKELLSDGMIIEFANSKFKIHID